MPTESALPAWKSAIENFMARPFIQHLLVALIIINAAILGMETSEFFRSKIGDAMEFLDNLILIIFLIEIVLLIAARGLNYFRDPWCVFDFIVVSIALLPATGSLSVLRALRVLRVLRLINKVESMRRVVAGLLSSLPGLGSVFGLILIIFYVASVIATNMFSKDFPLWFGDMASTSYTLFQVMTLEGWSEEIARPVMKVFPYSWIFFLSFILIATFIIVNLFIAIIVDSLNSTNADHAAKHAHGKRHGDPDLLEEMQALREELAQLRTHLQEQNPRQ